MICDGKQGAEEMKSLRSACIRAFAAVVFLFTVGARPAMASPAHPAGTERALFQGSPGAQNPVSLLSFKPVRHAVVLAENGRVSPILVDQEEPAPSVRAVADLAADLEAVTGRKPAVLRDMGTTTDTAIIVGTLGHSRIIDAMVRAGRIDLKGLRGKWEAFLIASVDRPLPGIGKALVVVGSDRRGTIFGTYEISRAIGVSPWAWWADIAPRHQNAVYALPGVRRLEEPSVRYRGIFVNDEDWGLFPWASKTFDPERNDIGPKTYARIFELLLRLKANTLWPAMHKTTAAFNSDPANGLLAEQYGIVMGASHSEAMLRNNVGEWHEAPERFNYVTNADAVRAYWEERVRANAGFENLWTIGMRGLHDTGIVGTRSMADKVALLDRIITDQRAMLDRYVPGGAAGAGQIFIPYKEVLDIYRAGLKVPDNVTIVWPDDNFGYIRQFPSKAEASRPGGTGVYYHLSYLGYPLAYLWLSTTPPALVREEMVRAYDAGARNMWIVNVGDIKPAEIGTTHFLDMAWNVGRYRGTSQTAYLREWFAQAFSQNVAGQAASLMDEYFRLNFERRPEHLEWPAKDEDRHLSGFTMAEADYRLRRWRELSEQAHTIGSTLPGDRQDAWFELVEFPIRAAAAANIRFFAAERYDEMIEVSPPVAHSAGGAIVWAEDEIKALTDRYNNQIVGGKWRYLMPAEPADSQWRIYRPRPIVAPAEGLRSSPDAYFRQIDQAPPPVSPVIEAEDAASASGWRLVEGLGRGRGVLIADARGLPWSTTVALAEGQSGIALGLLPMFPDGDERALHLEVTIDGGAPVKIELPRQVGSPAWVTGVLDNLLMVPVAEKLAPGTHRISIVARSGGVALDRIYLQSPAGPPHP